jgi:hypothetical protein
MSINPEPSTDVVQAPTDDELIKKRDTTVLFARAEALMSGLCFARARFLLKECVRIDTERGVLPRLVKSLDLLSSACALDQQCTNDIVEL